MNRNGPGYKAMMDRIALGTPFKTRDITDAAKAAGMKYGAAQLANQVTQKARNAGEIVALGARRGNAYLWQSAKTAPPAPPEAAPPVVRSPAVVGPLDPNTECEGVNTGLTEQVAEWLWREVGGSGEKFDHFGCLRDINPMEAFGWRLVADKLIRLLLELGMRGPGPGPDVSGTWTTPWNYNIGDWSVQDEAGGFVAQLLDGDAAHLITAAPGMRNAILATLANHDERGGIKRGDIEALRASLPKTDGA